MSKDVIMSPATDGWPGGHLRRLAGRDEWRL